MKSSEVRKKYLDFFEARGHAVIPSASLIPENDPTTLFTSSGMQPLIPFLLGAPHPSGKRLVDSQKSFRAQDIEEVGDNRHTTFFEMLGNWSLGDYFKEKQLPWIFEFLTHELRLEPKRLYVSVFEGNGSVEKDTESVALWKELFARHKIEAKEGERIFAYPAKKNWWSRSGEPEKMPPGEPGGPDSEVFFDFGEHLGLHERSAWKNQRCHPNCDCGRFMEIANSVFMQYQKQADGSLKELLQKNVDFGGGLERLVAATNNDPDVFKIDTLLPLIEKLSQYTNVAYGVDSRTDSNFRIIADHIRASAFLIKDGVMPSNKTQGYVLRRLIRRAALKLRGLSEKTDLSLIHSLTAMVAGAYEGSGYFEYREKHDQVWIADVVFEEIRKFDKTLNKGLREIEKIKTIDGTTAFYLYETFGFPWEMTEEIARGRGQNVQKGEFERAFKTHQEKSRTAAAGMFKGGLADHGEKTTKLHTATHLLHQALRNVLGQHISQKGSNITAERLRFDFSHPSKLTIDETRKVEELVNQKIKADLPVSFTVLSKDEALHSGALAFFGERYGEKVKVYTIGDFSKEICGGPHVAHTGTLGTFRIIKEESAGAGIRRIYADVSE